MNGAEENNEESETTTEESNCNEQFSEAENADDEAEEEEEEDPILFESPFLIPIHPRRRGVFQAMDAIAEHKKGKEKVLDEEKEEERGKEIQEDEDEEEEQDESIFYVPSCSNPKKDKKTEPRYLFETSKTRIHDDLMLLRFVVHYKSNSRHYPSPDSGEFRGYVMNMANAKLCPLLMKQRFHKLKNRYEKTVVTKGEDPDLSSQSAETREIFEISKQIWGKKELLWEYPFLKRSVDEFFSDDRWEWSFMIQKGLSLMKGKELEELDDKWRELEGMKEKVKGSTAVELMGKQKKLAHDALSAYELRFGFHF